MSSTKEVMEKSIIRVEAEFSKKDLFDKIFKDGQSKIEFAVDDLNLCKWEYKLFSQDNDNVTLLIKCKAPNNSIFRNSKIWNECLNKKFEITTVYDSTTDEWTCASFCHKKTLRNKANDPFFNDELKLVCEVEIWRSIETNNNFTELSSSEHLRGLLYKGRHYDIKLIAEGREFKCHKCIVAEMSPVLETTFYKGKVNVSQVNIGNITAPVLEEVIHFMYTGKIVKLEYLPDIMKAADRLQIYSLKNICKQMSLLNIRKETVLPILIVAEEYKDENMKKAGLDFIRKSHVDLTELFATREWMKILENKLLAYEVANAVKSIYAKTQSDPNMAAPPEYSSLGKFAYKETPSCPELDLSDLDLNGEKPGASNIYPEIS